MICDFGFVLIFVFVILGWGPTEGGGFGCNKKNLFIKWAEFK